MLKSRIPEIARTLDTRVEPVVARAAKRIAADASTSAPKGSTGELAEGYEAEEVDGGWAVMALWRYFFTEFGTSEAAAQPHLIPAVERERARIDGEKLGSL